MLPVDEVRIDPIKVNDIGLGKSIYTKEQLDEFAPFQDSQGMREGLPGGDGLHRPQLERRMGPSPQLGGPGVPYRHSGSQFLSIVQSGGANDLLFVTGAASVGSFQANGHRHDPSNSDSKMQGVRNLGVNGSLGDPVSAGNLAL
jgi:hypothetical protein